MLGIIDFFRYCWLPTKIILGIGGFLFLIGLFNWWVPLMVIATLASSAALVGGHFAWNDCGYRYIREEETRKGRQVLDRKIRIVEDGNGKRSYMMRCGPVGNWRKIILDNYRNDVEQYRKRVRTHLNSKLTSDNIKVVDEL